MKISAETKINELLKAYPFLEDFLARYNPKFELLKNKAMRASVGRVASLKMVASIGDVDLATLLAAISKEIESKAGKLITVGDITADAAPDKAERMDLLKEVIKDLHEGGDLEEAREKFAVAVGDVETTEIAEMEEQLIREGLAVEEVQRLCDVHVGAFREILDAHDEVKMPAGHPVHTYMQENRRIETLLDELNEQARKLESGEDMMGEIGRTVEALAGIDNHYVRKENQLFPVLERHGVTGPSKVMWGVHDQIRGSLKKVRGAVSKRDVGALPEAAAELARSAAEMIYKEEKILFPLCIDTLTEEEWRAVKSGEDELGYAFAVPGSEWPEAAEGSGVAAPPEGDGTLLKLDTGALSLEQVNLLLNHLRVDISFVDENDEVRYYSGGERHFPRSPEVIGRKVQNCHPPKSVHIVERILSEFRAGKQDKADFWIEHGGKFLLIRYFAVRDADGSYRGCLEVSQDITEIRKLEGERRLLDWE